MQTELQEQAMQLTRRILGSYWSDNHELLREYAHSDIQWIGATEDEFLSGIDEVLGYLERKVKNETPARVTEEALAVVWTDVQTCVVAGRYRLFANAGDSLADTERVTFVWVEENGNLKIIHIHQSAILYLRRENEKYPIRAGRDVLKFVQSFIKEREQQGRVSFKDTKNATYLLDYADIYYVEADRNYTVVHRADKGGDIRIRESLTHVVGRLNEDFFMISRSCAVNLFYAQRLDGSVLTMVEGTQLAVSNSRRQQLAEMMQRQVDKDSRSKNV